MLLAVAAIAIGALSFLAVRHFMGDDAGHLDAATMSETSGLIVPEHAGEPVATPIVVGTDGTAANDTGTPATPGMAPAPDTQRTAFDRD